MQLWHSLGSSPAVPVRCYDRAVTTIALPTAAVLTVSDAGSRGERVDTAGPAVVALLRANGFEVTMDALVPDEPNHIAGTLRHWADDDHCALVVTAGGTGLGPRDRTPEATTSVCDYLVPGMAEAMRAAS